MKECKICGKKHNRKSSRCKLCAYFIKRFQQGNKLTTIAAIEKTKAITNQLNEEWIQGIPLNGTIKSNDNGANVAYSETGINVDFDIYELFQINRIKNKQRFKCKTCEAWINGRCSKRRSMKICKELEKVNV